MLIMIEEMINYVFDFFWEYGFNVWFDWEVKDFLLVGFIFEYFLNGKFIKEIDIMDVWFDFGLLY